MVASMPTAGDALRLAKTSRRRHGKSPSRQHQIGQAKQREQLRRVFCEPTVTGLAMSKQVLDDVEGMLDFGRHARLEDFEFLPHASKFCGGQRFA